MNKRALLGLACCAVMAAVVLPPTASAKQVTELRVCGASACNEISDPARLRVWLDGGFEEAHTPPPGNYYRVSMGWGEGVKTLHVTPTVWLPAAHVIRAWGSASGSWWRLSDAQDALLRDAAHGLDPAGRLNRASLGRTSSSSGSRGGHTALYAGVGAGVAAGLALLAVARRQRAQHSGRRGR